MRFTSTLLISLAVGGLFACTAAVATDPAPVVVTPAEDQKAPDFTGGGQQANIGDPVYPGPYGIGIGSVIPNYRFFGYPQPNLDKVTANFLNLSDFYNPTGTGVFPAGSPYGEGTLKPKAIIMDRSAVWCVPCQDEAENGIPPLLNYYAPKGMVMLLLDDGPARNSDASQEDLTTWVNQFGVNYPATIDPNNTIGGIVGQEAYPANVLVRTRDMKIIKWKTGGPDQPFVDTFDDVINDRPVLPGE